MKQPSGRPFVKGQSGNPKGRKPLGDSLAEQIRHSATPERREKLFDQMWMLAADAHGDPHARIKAAEWLAKHGWPQEASGKTTIETDATGKTTVTHVHQNA